MHSNNVLSFLEKNSFKPARILLFWVIVAFLLYTPIYVALLRIDSQFDLDGSLAYNFPVHGQDAPEFVSLSQNLLEKHTFSLGTYPETFRTPGYPFFLALIQILFRSLLVVPLVQILLTGLAAFALYQIGTRLSTALIGFWSALLFLFSPLVLFQTLLILSDSLFVSLVVIGVYLVFFAGDKKWHLALGGLLLGFASLVRPIGLYLSLFTALFLLVHYGFSKKTFTRVCLPRVALFLMAFYLMIVPWAIRNKAQAGVFGISSLGTYNLVHYNIPAFLESKYGAHSPVTLAYTKEVDSIPNDKARSIGYTQTLQPFVTSFLSTHFLEYSRFHILGSSKFFLSSTIRFIALSIASEPLHAKLGLSSASPDLLSTLRAGNFVLFGQTLKSQLLIDIERVLLILVTILFFAGSLWFIFKHSNRSVLILFALVLYFALLTGPVSIPRYRLPAAPFVILVSLVAAREVRHRFGFFRKG